MTKQQEMKTVYWIAGIMLALAFLSVAVNALGAESREAPAAATGVSLPPPASEVEAVSAETGVEAEVEVEPGGDRPRIDVVFVLDTTGSMSGLIEGAKRKIWAILNQIASGKPTPDIRVGLVGYRDRGDEYVTKFLDLTDDLDAMYEALMAFEAGGGGDTPESVNQALNEAVVKSKWAEGDDVLKIVFLVGDAPPHMDYQDDVKFPQTCERAVRANIIINSVQCGSIGGTDQVWQQIADLSEGKYVAIDQSGGMRAIRTPYDEEIAKLDGELRGTVVYYGDAGIREEARRRAETLEATVSKAAPEAAADRAMFMMSGRAASKPGVVAGASVAAPDLVAAVESKTVDLDEVAEEELPAAMKAMSAEEREAYLKETADKRADIQAKLKKLNQQRAEFLAKEMKKTAGGERDAFDAKVIESIRERADKIGVKYEEPEGK